jgi:hypothetical protein
MSNVYTIQTQIKAPSKACPTGQVAIGHYVIDGNTLTMTDDRGEPAVDGDGKRYVHTLAPDDDPIAIACHLTRELRTALRGSTVNGFDGPIQYPKTGWR